MRGEILAAANMHADMTLTHENSMHCSSWVMHACIRLEHYGVRVIEVPLN